VLNCDSHCSITIAESSQKGDKDMPRVRVEWLAIRTQEQREALARRITEAVVEVAGVRPDQVTVVFDEQAPTLVIKGGVPWSRILEQGKEES
jgi:phenylpyruvate tautomerase PptA (4-oxalocrotonate tautomerase family)